MARLPPAEIGLGSKGMPNLVQTLPLAFDMPNLIQMLPLAFVMIAGQQIASAGFFAKSVDWRRNSVTYIAGVALSMMLFVTAAYLIAKCQPRGRITIVASSWSSRSA